MTDSWDYTKQPIVNVDPVPPIPLPVDRTTRSYEALREYNDRRALVLAAIEAAREARRRSDRAERLHAILYAVAFLAIVAGIVGALYLLFGK